MFCLKTLVLAGCVLCNHGQAACVAPSLIAPWQTEVSAASPRFEWTPVNDAHHYLIWLESRVPEGRVLLTEEFQTSATFLTPARPLTSSKATVRIRVTAVCNDNTQATTSARFRIVEDKACRLKSPPRVEPDSGQWTLRWESLPLAQRYEIRMHTIEDGKPVFTRESSGSTTTLGRPGTGVWMLAVQPVCRGLKGVNSWVAVENVPAPVH
jgi:hypothetical protein